MPLFYMYYSNALGENFEMPIALTLGNLGGSTVACINQPVRFNNDGTLDVSISCPAGTIF